MIRLQRVTSFPPSQPHVAPYHHFNRLTHPKIATILKIKQEIGRSGLSQSREAEQKTNLMEMSEDEWEQI